MNAPDAQPVATVSQPLLRRLAALALLISTAGVLLLAAALDPNPAGMGTHTQMGLAPCGFKTAVGLPCATCGMTTSFSHAAHGQLLQAAIVQPAGTLLALLTAALAVAAGWSLVTGASLAPLGRVLWRPRSMLMLGAAVLLAWLYTVACTFGS